MKTITLNNGVEMPLLGYGVFRIAPDKTQSYVEEALSVGYRLIDTAEYYKNEQAVGKALKASAVPRDQIFLTTKVWYYNYGYEETLQAVQGSLKRLQTDYLDLILIHQPFNDYYGAYRAFEKLYREGTVRAIGVSNFLPDRYLDIARFARVTPQVNQMETHVYNQNKELHSYMREQGTVLESWGPLGQSRMGISQDPTLMAIGQKYGKTASQVALRFLTQEDIVAIPKSTNKDHIRENLDIFDFTLDQKEMDRIRALDRKETVQGDQHDPERVKDILSRTDN